MNKNLKRKPSSKPEMYSGASQEASRLNNSIIKIVMARDWQRRRESKISRANRGQFKSAIYLWNLFQEGLVYFLSMQEKVEMIL